MKKAAFVISLLIAQWGQSAAAALVTFDFTSDNYGYTNGSYVFTGNDSTSTVTVSAGNRGNHLVSYLSGSQWGLLVCTGGAPSAPRSNSSCGSHTDDFHYIDGGKSSNPGDPDEYVSLDFGGEASLTQASFYRSSRGDFDLFADGVRVLDEKSVSNVVNFGAGEDGSLFHFLADGSSDYFKLKTVTVDFVNVSPIPVPSAAWLFASALLGLGSVARRKQA